MSDITETLEKLVQLLNSLSTGGRGPARGQEILSGRLFLAINELDEPELYVKGPKASFSVTGLGQVVSWGMFTVDGGDPIPALVLRTSAGVDGSRVMAHIAYEASRLIIEGVDNRELMERLRPFLLLAQSRKLLSPEFQTGLVGELLFLEKLLDVCADRRSEGTAINAWVGPLGAQHDFYQDSLVVEVKSGPGKSHRVGYFQLLADEGEDLLLASVDVRRDPSAQLKLPDVVDRVSRRLSSDDLKRSLYARLEKYGGSGYDLDSADHYRADQGFDVGPVELRRITLEQPILSPRSFTPGHPTATVSDIRYVLDVSGIPTLPADEARVVFERLAKVNES